MNVSKKYMHTVFDRHLVDISSNSMRESRLGHQLLITQEHHGCVLEEKKTRNNQSEAETWKKRKKEWVHDKTMSLKKMQVLEDELFLSNLGKVKIERVSGDMNWQLHRHYTSTSTMFLLMLFLITMTVSYLSFLSFVDLDMSWVGVSHLGRGRWSWGARALRWCRRELTAAAMAACAMREKER
jgi:hypothetical protein